LNSILESLNSAPPPSSWPGVVISSHHTSTSSLSLSLSFFGNLVELWIPSVNYLYETSTQPFFFFGCEFAHVRRPYLVCRHTFVFPFDLFIRSWKTT
jgi:hypothetical protein